MSRKRLDGICHTATGASHLNNQQETQTIVRKTKKEGAQLDLRKWL